MEAYRRLAAVTNAADVDDVLAEWNDRYGPPPAPAAVLLDVARLRAECLRLGIRAVSVQKGRARLDGWELRKSQEARLKRLSDRSQVLGDAVIVPVTATADVSLPQALLRLLSRDRSGGIGPDTLHRMKRFLVLLRRGRARSRSVGIGVLEHAQRRRDDHVFAVRQGPGGTRHAAPISSTRFARSRPTSRSPPGSTRTAFPINGDVTTGSNVAAMWLGQLIHQKAIDALFAARHLKVTPGTAVVGDREHDADLPDARHVRRVSRGVPEGARRPRGPARGAHLVVRRHVRQGRPGLLPAHKAQFALRVGHATSSHILVATSGGGAADPRPAAQRRRLRDARQDEVDRHRQRRARAARSAASRPTRSSPPFQAAAEAAPFGTPVGPVHSQYGYHVILVTHAEPNYAASRSQVQQALRRRKVRPPRRPRSPRCSRRSRCTIDPRFGTWDRRRARRGRRSSSSRRPRPHPRTRATRPPRPPPSPSANGTP